MIRYPQLRPQLRPRCGIFDGPDSLRLYTKPIIKQSFICVAGKIASYYIAIFGKDEKSS